MKGVKILKILDENNGLKLIEDHGNFSVKKGEHVFLLTRDYELAIETYLRMKRSASVGAETDK